MRDYYDILGVTRGADDAALKSAFQAVFGPVVEADPPV